LDGALGTGIPAIIICANAVAIAIQTTSAPNGMKASFVILKHCM